MPTHPREQNPENEQQPEQDAPPEAPSMGLSIQQQMMELDRKKALGQVQVQQDPMDPEGLEADDDGSDTVSGPVIGAVRGVGRAANEMSNFAVWTGKNVLKHTGAYKLFGDDEADKEWLEWYDEKVTETNPLRFDIAERPDGFWGFYEGITQFVAPFSAFSKGMKVGQAATYLGRLGKATAAGAATDFTSFDPYEARLSNLVAQSPVPVANTVAEFMAADEDDGALENRLKAAMEGLVLGATIDTFASGLRGWKAWRRFKTGQITREEAIEQFNTIGAKVEQIQNADRESLQEAIDDAAAKEGEPTPRTDPEDVTAEGLAEADVEPFGIREADDGSWELTATKEARDLLGDDIPENLRADTRMEAERTAAAFNLTHKYQQAKKAPVERIEFDNAQLSALTGVVRRYKETNDFDAVMQSLEGTDLNLQLINASSDTKAHVEALSEVIRPIMDDVRDHRTQAEIMRDAEDLLPKVTADELIDGLGAARGQLQEVATKVMAARILFWSQGRRITQLSRILELDPRNPVALRQFAEEAQDFGNLGVQIVGVKSEGGRFLKSLDEKIDADALENARAAAKEADEEAAAKESVDNMIGEEETAEMTFMRAFREGNLSAEEVYSMARAFSLTEGNPRAVARLMGKVGDQLNHKMRVRKGLDDRTTFQKGMDAIVSFRASMMLSGLKTQFVNTVGNIATTAMVNAERYNAGIIHEYTTGDAALRKEAVDLMKAPWADDAFIMRQAFTAMKKSLKESRTFLDPRYNTVEHGFSQNFPDSQDNPLAQALVFALGMPERLMMGADELIKRTNYMSHVRSKSIRNLEKEFSELGFQPSANDMSRRIYADLEAAIDGDDLATGAASGLFPKASEYAQYTTHTKALEKGTTWDRTANLVYGSRFLQWVMPFVRTPLNLFKFSLQRVPVLGGFQREMQEMWKAGGEQRAQMLGRQAMGTLAYGMAIDLARAGHIRGKGPDNPELRSQMREAGWEPYTVNVGGKWVSYRRLEPVSTPFALVADFYTFMGDMEEESAEEAGIALMTAMSASVTDKSFLLGISEFFEAVGANGDEYKMQKLWESLGSSMSPAIARQMNPDDVWREADGIWETIKRGIPGASKTLEPSRNILGEPVPITARKFMNPTAGYLNQAINPFTVIDPKDQDELLMTLAKLNNALPRPPEDLMGGEIDLRDREKWVNRDPERAGQSPADRWRQLLNEQGLREHVAAIVETPQWKALPSGDEQLAPGGLKYKMLEEVFDEHIQKAKERVFWEYPDLQRAQAEHKLEVLRALQSN